VPGLTILALFLRQKRWKLKTSGLDPDTERYLDQIGFRTYITSGRGGILLDADQGWSLALQPLTPNILVEELSDRLIAIVTKHGFEDPSSLSALKIAFAEILENIRRHAQTEHALAGAQYYPKRRKLHFVAADSGIGIHESFIQGRNEEIKHLIRKESDALECAMRPMVTSKPVVDGVSLGHAGFGLYIVSELARRNHGTFSLTSGGTTVMRFSRYGQPVQTITHHAPWQGTILQVLLDLDSRLPIQEVYRSLPPALGFELVDYFQ
jgi:hypothetical protein